MASIVKELDKVTGTTTRSHNIADAVKKLSIGSGADIEAVSINYDTERQKYVLNKTWKELRDIAAAGKLAVTLKQYPRHTESGVTLESYHLGIVLSVDYTDARSQEGEETWKVRILDGSINNPSLMYTYFTAQSENDYPTSA